MHKISLTILTSLTVVLAMSQGNVGIKTTNPLMPLHIDNGNVLFTGPNFIGSGAANIEDQAPGTKFLWISNRAALRAGRLMGTEWGVDSIGAYSFAFGSNVNAEGYASAVFGAGNRTGYYAFAAGYGNKAMADDAAAFGQYNRVDGRGGSLVSGESNISKSYAATVVGRFNDTTSMTSANSPGANNPFFVVGNGTANNARSNALTVMNSGRVGILTSAPAGMLHIKANSSTGLPHLLVEETENEYARIKMKNTGNAYWDIAANPQADQNNAYFNIFHNNGTTGSDRLSLRGNGNLWIAGNYSNASDARLKKDIQEIDGSMDKLEQLNAYQYHWKAADMGTDLQTGLLAQEVEKVFPELVVEDDRGMKAVNYIGLIPHLLNAIKDQQKAIAELQQKVAEK
jgi:Chaperone of endosialidase